MDRADGGRQVWTKVFGDLKARGCQDVVIAATDALKDMSNALAAVSGRPTLQTCIVHRFGTTLISAIRKSGS